MSRWQQMSADERFYTLQAMSRYGGGFVSALAEAWSRADGHNSARLSIAFGDYVDEYGPGTQFFDACVPKERAK